MVYTGVSGTPMLCLRRFFFFRSLWNGIPPGKNADPVCLRRSIRRISALIVSPPKRNKNRKRRHV